MNRTKSLKLLALLLGLSTQSAFAETNLTSPVIISPGGSHTFTDDTTITLSIPSSNAAIKIDGNGSVGIDAGKILQIDAVGANSDAIYVFASSGNASVNLGEVHIKSDQRGIYGLTDAGGVNSISVKIGSKSTIDSSTLALSINRNTTFEAGDQVKFIGASYGPSVATISVSNGGQLTIGDQVEIGHDDRHGYGLNGKALLVSDVLGTSFPDSLVTIGNNSHIYTLGTGTGNHAVQAGDFVYYEAIGNIKIGDDAQISTVGETSFGAYGAYLNSSLELGERATITTLGKNSSAIRSGTAYSAAGNPGGGTVTVGKGAFLQTSGTSAHGADSRYLGSLIKIGSDSVIEVNGTSAYGVYAYNGGRVELDGAKISSAKSYALYSSGRDTSTQQGSAIYGDGKFIINGDIYAGVYGNIDMSLRAGSIFTGKTSVSTIAGSNLNLLLDTNADWQMTGNSKVSALHMAGGDVHFATNASSGTYGTLTVADLSGTGGTFYMRTDLVGDGAGNNAGDKLIVSGTSQGSHSIQVQNSGSANTDGTETLTLIETQDGATSGVAFGLTNVVELGGYQYTLRQDENNENHWVLYGSKIPGPGTPSNPANAGINLFSGSYLLNYAEINTLMQRMGDLRDGDQNGNIWARTFGGEMTTKGDRFLRGYDMSYWGLQVGADKKFNLKKGDLYVGGMFGYSKGDIDYRHGSGSIDSTSVGAYSTYIADNGFYTDLVLKYGWMKDDFNVYDSAGNPVKGSDIETNAITASLEIGKKFYWNTKEKQGWYIEPQGQLSFSHMNGDSFTASNGLRISVDSVDSTLGRLGTNIGYEVKGGKNPINAYAKVSYVHEFDGDVNYRLNRSKESTSYGDSWWTYGVGITAKVGQKHHLYLDLERASGGNFTQKWAINGGYRFAW